MENKLNELKEKRRVLGEEYRDTMCRIKDSFNETLNQLFLCKHGATLYRFNITQGSWRGCELMFELNFLDEDGKPDFGSDATFYFESKYNVLRVNYGTIGAYSKNDIYQVKRVHLISDIFNNIEEIESSIINLINSEDCALLESIDDKIYKVECEIREAEKEAHERELKKIENSLHIDNTVEYSYNVRYSSRRFYGLYKISKVGNKSIWVTEGCRTKRISKVEFLEDIYKGTILVNGKTIEEVLCYEKIDV